MQEEELSNAQAQVLHYKTVLSQTEELLNRLQSRVEAEEQSWKTKILQLESEMNVAKKEKQFWMDQCQKQEVIQQQLGTQEDVTSLSSRIECLQKEKEQALQVLKRTTLFSFATLQDKC